VRELSQQRVVRNTAGRIGQAVAAICQDGIYPDGDGAQIAPVGWDNWRNPHNEKTAYYAEYESRGPGAAPGQRAGWSKQLTAREAKRYTVQDVLGNWVKDYL
jgi:pectin methylesterase-like acyl-CoA thioesterase